MFARRVPFLPWRGLEHAAHVGATSTYPTRTQADPGRNDRPASTTLARRSLHGVAHVVMTVHRLSVSDGYRYLTRHVACGDSARGPDDALGDYYLTTGTPPGRWRGAGAADLGVGGEVTLAQMQALFQHGAHPDRGRIVAEHVGAGMPAAEAHATCQLGRRFMTFSDGRRRAVAGYDLVFTPVKSVSLLWALGGDQTRREVERAHHEAMADVLGWLEANAVFSRVGAQSRQRIAVRGLICAAFDHRDSRSGDPHLHTHLAVSTKVRAVDDAEPGNPRWLALDSSVLRAAKLTAAERYTTRVEDRLGARLGVEFATRPDTVRQGKQAVREIAGVPTELIGTFSKRRAQINERHTALVQDYRTRNGRRASAAVEAGLAQLAAAVTRPAKQPPRTLGSQIDTWTTQAHEADGTAIASIASAVGRSRVRPEDAPPDVDTDSLARAALVTLSAKQATWTRWNVVAQVERVTRPLGPLTQSQRDEVVCAVTERALHPDLSVRLTSGAGAPQLHGREQVLGRVQPVDRARYTTTAVLQAERQLVEAAREQVPPRLSPSAATSAVAAQDNPADPLLDADGRALAVWFTAADRRVVAAVAPSGAARTAAVRAACRVWDRAGVRVIPLATCDGSAAALTRELGRRADNVHTFVAQLAGPPAAGSDVHRLDRGDVLLVHEAGLAGTAQLAALLAHARAVGAGIRLLTDPAELAAAPSGSVMRLIATEVGGPRPRSHRLHDHGQATAALQIRARDPACLQFFLDNGRLHSGGRNTMVDAALRGWCADIDTGHSSLIIAATDDDAADLSARAQAHRNLWGSAHTEGAELADGNHAGVGDWIVTGASLREVTTHGGRDFVKRADHWLVLDRSGDNSLTVGHRGHRGRLVLPGGFVCEQVRLGYATTADRVGDLLVDTAHPIVTRDTSREALYVGATCARLRTTFYVSTTGQRIGASGQDRGPSAAALRILTDLLCRPDHPDGNVSTGHGRRPDSPSLDLAPPQPSRLSARQRSWLACRRPSRSDPVLTAQVGEPLDVPAGAAHSQAPSTSRVLTVMVRRRPTA